MLAIWKINQSTHSLLMGIQNGTSTVENSLRDPQKVKHRITI